MVKFRRRIRTGFRIVIPVVDRDDLKIGDLVEVTIRKSKNDRETKKE